MLRMCPRTPRRTIFFKMAMRRMEDELKQKAVNTKRFMTFVF